MFIIGLVGSFGSGCSFIAKNILIPMGFKYISLSEILKDEYMLSNPSIKRENIERPCLQDFGNEIRKNKGSNYLATVALKKAKEEGLELFIIDSIRNPEEIKYIKENVIDFYVFGIFAEQDNRWDRVNKKYNDDHGKFVIDEGRDKGEKVEYGQHVTDCFLLSDVIITNNKPIQGRNDAYIELEAKIKKYLDLFQRRTENKIPTEVESIMAMAYANSLRSSCLKRKVGAVIADENANIFSSGYNEVPPYERPCKGMYGECYRNYYKNEIGSLFGNDSGLKESVMKKVKLLEKCRALHAEENAILNIAKSGSASVVKNATLYTTTYPCNLCANKISQVNIKKIVYFEPYPVEEAKKTLTLAKIEQEMFEGITYNSYFKVYSELIL